MTCRICAKETLVEFIDLGQQPLANKYPKPEEFATEDFFPLKVFFCTSCKAVQLGTVVSRERMFVDYYYLSSVNPGLVRHFEEFARSLASAKFVVDVGSNDGILLRPLKALGVKAIGIEPSINVSKIANDQGLTTMTAFLNDESAAALVAQHGKADVVVTSSVFTHLEDPHQFIEATKKVMTDDGSFIIEVEYIGNMLKNVQFERFYFDRVFYYSVTSLRDLFAAHGMYVSDVEHIEQHGGSIRVTTHLVGHGPEPSARFAAYIEEERTTMDQPSLEHFAKLSNEYVAAFKHKLIEYKEAGLRVAGYGAPARVATICNFGDIGPSLIEFIIDDSPLKQHRCSPGTHIPIEPNTHLADHRPDVLVVFAYEYFDDIKKKVQGNYRFLIPIPPREVA